MCPLYSALKYSNGYKTKAENILTFFNSSFLLQMALIKSKGALQTGLYQMRSFDFITAAASSTETNFFLYASFQLILDLPSSFQKTDFNSAGDDERISTNLPSYKVLSSFPRYSFAKKWIR